MSAISPRASANVEQALLSAVNGLAGMPPNELDRMIEKWRKNTTE